MILLNFLLNSEKKFYILKLTLRRWRTTINVFIVDDDTSVLDLYEKLCENLV